MHTDRNILTKARLIVVKLGTGILSTHAGGLDTRRIARLASQVATLRKKSCHLVLVSSGAIGAGMGRLKLKKRPTRISDLQACAAIGQNLLMASYERAFTRLGITVAHILLTHDDMRHAERRNNARHTLLNLIRRGVVPVVNENDAVSFAEIKFGDNDQLAAMVHELIHAHACVILSNIDGFIVGSNRVLPTIKKITAEIERHAGDSNSHRSVGGMRSKLLAARRVLATGRPFVIANGQTPNILPRLFSGAPLGTIFL